MRKIDRLFAVAALTAGICFLAPNPAAPDQRVGSKGRINYDKGMLYATGHGAVSARTDNEAKAYLSARRFATLDAQRNMLAVIRHVRIDSRTTGADFETVSDVIRAEIRGVLKGAEIVSERTIKRGRNEIVEVTIATPLYGRKGISRVFMRELVRRNRKQGPDRVANVEIMRKESGIRMRAGDDTKYTSLIIDTLGLKVERSMSPKIRKPDGSEVWGSVDADPDYVIEHGVVAYAKTMPEARENKRTGDNPLILRAVGRAGGNFNSDAVITDTDAATLLTANARSKFLDNYKVIFVVDPSR